MIKKILLRIALVLIGFGTANGQVIQGTSNAGTDSGQFDYVLGVKAGFGASTFSTSEFAQISSRVSFYLGGIAEIPAFFDDFYLQPEILFVLQGADIGSTDLGLYYLQIPLMGKYHITDEIAVELGPQVGFLIADNWETLATGVDTNKIDFGLAVGVGYRLNENLYFQLRYSPGFTNIFDNNTDLKNSAFYVGGAYFF